MSDSYNLRWDSNTSENSVDDTSVNTDKATPDQVLDGYPYKDSDTRELLYGTMLVNDDEDITLAYNSIYRITKGYHSGNSIIKVIPLKDCTEGTATEEDIVSNKVAWVNGIRLVGKLDKSENDMIASATVDDILDGKTAWVRRVLITGKIPMIERNDITLNANESYTIAKGYHSGTMKVVAASLVKQTEGTATAEDIAYGKTAWVNGVLISGTSVSFNDRLSDATAVAKDIRLGKTAYTAFGKTIGDMPEYVSRPIKNLLAGQSFTVPEGYHDGLWTIQSTSLIEQTVATATAGDIRSGKTAWVNGILLNGTMIQNFAPNTDATAEEFDIKKGKTAWVNGELLTGINPYTSIDYAGRFDNKYDTNAPIIVTIPEHDWNKIAAIDVLLFDSDSNLKYEYHYTNFESGADMYESDGDKQTISIISAMGDPKIVFTCFVPDLYMKVYVNNYDLLRKDKNTEEEPILTTANLISGAAFNAAINKAATSFTRADALPDATIPVIDISNDKDNGIVTWYDSTNTTQYWYSDADVIYMNEDSSNMFNDCKSLTSLELSGFDTSKVTNMSYMFNWSCLLTSLDVSHFNTSNVTNMSGMFGYCKKMVLLDLSNFDTSKVTNMSSMFNYCNKLTSLELSGFDTSKVTNMSSMFDYCESLASLNLSNWNTSNVTRMDQMFRNCYALTSLNISNFNTSKVTSMYGMFNVCEGLTTLDLSHFDTSNVVNTVRMFNQLEKLHTLDISNFDTSKVTDMNRMFAASGNLTTIIYGNNFVNNKMTNSEYMFSGCPANKPEWTNGTWTTDGTFVKS